MQSNSELIEEEPFSTGVAGIVRITGTEKADQCSRSALSRSEAVGHTKAFLDWRV